VCLRTRIVIVKLSNVLRYNKYSLTADLEEIQ